MAPLSRFQALVEREWIAAGHPFATRCAHAAFASGKITGPAEAPIFVAFLDSVWQLQRQYPSSFEFTGEMLIALAEVRAPFVPLQKFGIDICLALKHQNAHQFSARVCKRVW